VLILVAAHLALVGYGIAAVSDARPRRLDRRIVTSVGERSKHNARRAGGPVRLVRCIAEHFELGNGGVTQTIARRRSQSWGDVYSERF
jgi:hypothetical protein